MRIEVDYDLCQGHGVCESECPSVFKVSKDTNQVVVLQAAPPEELREQVQAAVKFCPTLALTLQDGASALPSKDGASAPPSQDGASAPPSQDGASAPPYKES